MALSPADCSMVAQYRTILCYFLIDEIHQPAGADDVHGFLGVEIDVVGVVGAPPPHIIVQPTKADLGYDATSMTFPLQ